MKLLKQLFKGSVIVSSVTFIGHILSIALKVTISRIYGVEGFGLFSLIMVISRSLVTVAQMGYQQSITRFISKFKTENDWGNIYHFFKNGFKRIALASLILSFFIIITRDSLNSIFFEGISGNIALYVSGIMFIFVINNYLSFTLRGLKLFKQQSIIFNCMYPFLMIVSLAATKFIYPYNNNISVFLGIGITLNLILSTTILAIFIIKYKKFKISNEIYDLNALSKYSYPLWFTSILSSLFQRSDRIFLGLLSNLNQVGIYGAGLTFSILFSFPLKVMSPVFQPLIVEAHSKNSLEDMNILYNSIIKWSSYFTIPLFCLVICFGEYFMMLFGRDYEDAIGVLIVLSFSQAISTIVGPAGTMLNMTEKQQSHTKIMFCGVIANVTLNLILIPKFGALGAAIGTSFSSILINIFRITKVIQFYKIKTNLLPTTLLIIKFIPITIVCLYFIRYDVLPWIISLLIFTFFGTLTLFLSLDESEKKYLTLNRKKLI